jgi:hypothetical protein
LTLSGDPLVDTLIAQEAKSGDLNMQTAKKATSAHEGRLELLGFAAVVRPERPARAKRSVSAKVGLKPPPPPPLPPTGPTG